MCARGAKSFHYMYDIMTLYYVYFRIALSACLMLFTNSPTLFSPLPWLVEDITGGTITLNIKYGVVPYYSDTFSVCSSDPRGCPIKAGQGSLIFKHPIAPYKSPVSFYCDYNIIILVMMCI